MGRVALNINMYICMLKTKYRWFSFQHALF